MFAVIKLHWWRFTFIFASIPVSDNNWSNGKCGSPGKWLDCECLSSHLPELMNSAWLHWNTSSETIHPFITDISCSMMMANLSTEWGDDRVLDIHSTQLEEIQVVDTWNHAGEFENAFYTAPFQNVLLAENKPKKHGKWPKHFSHVFKVKAPLLKKNEVICLSGSSIHTGEWDKQKPLLFILGLENGWWTVKLDISKDEFPLHYKYGVYNTKEKGFVQFKKQEGTVHSSAMRIITSSRRCMMDLYIFPTTTGKEQACLCPYSSCAASILFGLQVNSPDLKIAGRLGLKMRPQAHTDPARQRYHRHSYLDRHLSLCSLISAFALHPLYLNLATVAGKKYADVIRPLKKSSRSSTHCRIWISEAVMMN